MGAEGKGLGLRAPPAPLSLLCGFTSRRGPHLRPPWRHVAAEPGAAGVPAGRCRAGELSSVCRARDVLRKPRAQAARPVCEFLAQQLLLREAGASGVARRARFSTSTGNGRVVSEHRQGGH